MRRIGVAATVVLLASSLDWGQQRSAVPLQTPSTTSVQPQIHPPVAAEGDASKETSRTSKQKLLDDQALRLVNMANELKAAVDKTNKNILSLDVVRKAEEIESLAHKMKDQGKK